MPTSEPRRYDTQAIRDLIQRTRYYADHHEHRLLEPEYLADALEHYLGVYTELFNETHQDINA